MSLPPEAIEEFKQIYKKEVGVELTDAEAVDKANRLFNFMKVVTKPVQKKEENGNTGKS
jgi:hypothetical protein